MVEVAEGVVIHGYRIEGLLGRGGMGEVHRARHEATGRVVALKSMNAQAATIEEFRKRFRREARAAMAVHHRNVVVVHEIFENDGTPFIAMEMLSGETLEERMAREGKLPLQLVARIGVRVASAVGTAHAIGIVHRDLKPENIFLVGGGADPDVKVLDFGIAKLTATDGAAAETAALTKTGALMGTPYYMSPEQAFGEKTIDQRSDVWALGIILYRALSGVLPTRANGFGEVFRLVVQASFPPLREAAPDVPAELAGLVDSMLDKKPAGRPWDLRACYDILRKHAETAAVVDVPTFGIAIAPLWDEDSSQVHSGSLERPRDSLAATPGGSKPLAMSPGALRRVTPFARPSTTILIADPRSPDGSPATAPSAAEPARPVAADQGNATLVYARPRTADPDPPLAADPPAVVTPTKGRLGALILVVLVGLVAAVGAFAALR